MPRGATPKRGTGSAARGRRPYHHGDLRRATLDAAAGAIATHGVASLNLRALARGIGVSHTALQSTFGDRAGLLVALAAEGFDRLATALEASPAGDAVALGQAYLAFAAAHPGHFAVMFSRDIVPPAGHALSAPLADPSERAFAAFLAGLGEPTLTPRALHAWGLVHGIAHLAVFGPLRERAGASQLAGLVSAALLQARL